MLLNGSAVFLLFGRWLSDIYSVQPKVSIRVDGATELGTKISKSEAAAANVRVMPELKFVADWPPQRLNSVARSTRIETFG